ncbi:MAG TPA: NnrU family protein [Kiloniellaceae bacterium]|nr:NnrU family protein [Kiloniellaceae bacterium]HIP77608.1 NnrU family protein [Kiloniellaceae bacterium]
MTNDGRQRPLQSQSAGLPHGSCWRAAAVGEPQNSIEDRVLMIEFALAILVFLGAHVLPAATGLRGTLIERMGRRLYVAAYSLVSLATIAWVIVAAGKAPYIELWPPGAAAARITFLAMIPASLLLAGAVLRPNPLSVSFRGGMTDRHSPGLLALTRHPILWAFFFWAAGHLVANGDVVSVVLFGALAAFSLMGMRRLEKRARQRLSAEDLEAAMAVAGGPFAARLRRAASLRTGLELLAGLLLYGFFLHVHEAVIGVDPLAAF